jgi:hypothetical protein
MSLIVKGDVIRVEDESSPAARVDGDLHVDGSAVVNSGIDMPNGNIHALNVSVEGNLHAPFGEISCAGVAAVGFVDVHGPHPTLPTDPPFPEGIAARVNGHIDMPNGNIHALNVSVEGNLHAPFGEISCAGMAAVGFVDVHGNHPTLPTDPPFPFDGGFAARVGGNVLVNGTVNASDVLLTNADCAEEFEVDPSCAAHVVPGTVMVLGEDGRLAPCSSTYDKRVAGVVSGAGDFRPGIILGTGSAQSDGVAIALVGRVACNVDATHGAIAVGDLLTTSDVPGYAMKASDSGRAFGAVIGKALRPLREGNALIPILVALQ